MMPTSSFLSFTSRMGGWEQVTTSCGSVRRPLEVWPVTRWCRCCRPAVPMWGCWSHETLWGHPSLRLHLPPPRLLSPLCHLHLLCHPAGAAKRYRIHHLYNKSVNEWMMQYSYLFNLVHIWWQNHKKLIINNTLFRFYLQLYLNVLNINKYNK